jgi:hypothetical protein
MSQFKLQKQPFFKPGSLVFYGSGHSLIKDGKNYRCGRDSNQLCEFEDRRVKAESIERKFSRLGKSLHTKNLDPDVLIEKLMRENLCDLIFGAEDRINGKNQVADATLSVMQQEVIVGKKVKKKDEKDFTDNYINSLRDDHSVMLFGYAIGMIKVFTCDISEAEAGRSLAHFSKKIYVTDKNEIHSIELERWAWYVLNAVMERSSPGFLASKSKLKFTNKPDELHNLNIARASLKFGSEDFPEAIGENFLMPIVMMSKMKESMSFSLKGDINKMSQNLPELLNQFQNNPVLRILLGATPLITNQK